MSVLNAVPLRKTLFISHDARRHGAQLLLLHLLRWMREHNSLPFEVLCKGGGDLVGEFQALAPTQVVEHDSEVVNILRGRIDRGEFGLIYANTMANGDLLERLRPSCPVVSHIHELECMIRFHVGSHIFDLTRAHSTHYVAVSRAVLNNLVQGHGIPESAIDLVFECVPYRPAEIATAKREASSLRASLGLPENAFVVGGSGTTDWRKGPELFIQLARHAVMRLPSDPIYFLWIGGDRAGTQFGQLAYDVRQAGLGDRVRFLGEQHRPLCYFAMFDVFALVSREDPYPLVVLEAASLGVPIVGFRDSGGVSEFIETDCGFCVPYLAVEQMADRLIDLKNNGLLRLALGQRATRKFRERHTIDKTVPQIVKVIAEQQARGLTGGRQAA